MSSSTSSLTKPSGYKGLYAFHKYWGKKAHEPVAYAINILSDPGQIVLDPFVGSGITGREAVLRSRRFIGVDINPVAVELSRLLTNPPCIEDLQVAASGVENQARATILESYTVKSLCGVASHYLWDQSFLSKVWALSGRRRIELEPTEHDNALSEHYSDYKSNRIRTPKFFYNSRINTTVSMETNDILTGRAQRNIDILIDAIRSCSTDIQPALMLCLTAASGQMSKMVFAVTSRGKTKGKTSNKVEVGSWVIGYWRPSLHFEINVWNCFQRRVTKLQRAITTEYPAFKVEAACEPLSVISGTSQVCVLHGASQKTLRDIPDGAVNLIIADPPHGDRIPYLELSELWNSILGFPVNFEDEIVISNAEGRGKNSSEYVASFQVLFDHVLRILTRKGYFVLIFNARQLNWWPAFDRLVSPLGNGLCVPLSYLGYFPCTYSAGSVVQDNRMGSLDTDYAMVFGRSDADHTGKLIELANIPGWNNDFPEKVIRSDTNK